LIYAGAAVNWLRKKVNQFTAAHSWRSDPGLRQAVTLPVIFRQHPAIENITKIW
jgi:hypothetical protein